MSIPPVGPGDDIRDVIDSIEITPDPATMAADGTLQLTAIVHYSDAWGGVDVDETRDPDLGWMTSDDDVAYVNNGIWNGGLAVGRSAGSIQVGAWVSFFVNGIPDNPPPGPDTPSDNWTFYSWIDLEVTPAPDPPPDPEGRFLLAFDDPASEPYPTWTRLDTTPNLVASYTIDRGRTYELDRTDTGRATVQITDIDGVLDPTNPGGPYYGKIKPVLQAALGRYDPVAAEWKLRYRGFVEDFAYQTDPSQKLNTLVVSLVDQFDRLGRAEMQPGQCGFSPPAGSEGQIYYSRQRVADRISQILSDFAVPLPFRAVLPGSVELHKVVYSPGESPLSAIQEAADGEMPAVANVYCDRRGRLCFHSRMAKFFPVETAAGSGGFWEFNQWKIGDGAAIAASPTDTAQVRAFGFDRGLAKIINSATSYPTGIDDNEVEGQLVVDTASIGEYGVCSWSAPSLLTAQSTLDDSDDLTETKRFATYYVANYAQARDRVQDVALRSLHPDDPRAAANWQLLNGIDISDTVEITVAMSGGGGFTSELYFVEGIHEETRPLDPAWDDVTLRLDLSPAAYYTTNPWPDA